MMHYSSEPHAKNETHEVIKYLEFCVHSLHNEDPGIYNLLLSLYAKQEDDSALLRFQQFKFGKGRENAPDFFYDPKYALRLCLKEKRTAACVHIYSMMSMHEEAVALALQIDPELAMAEADKVEDDEDLRKKLWLMIAKHVVKQEKGVKRKNTRKAIAFLKETDGLLKIEDILPFFPDFALIDDFKVNQLFLLSKHKNTLYRSPILSRLRSILQEVAAPNPLRGPETFSWITNAPQQTNFTPKLTWETIRPSAPPQAWTRVAWFKGHVPRFAFHFWVAHLNRLPTRDRLFMWGRSATMLCCICGLGLESRDHIFLHCPFGEQVWYSVLRRLGQPQCTFHNWNVLIIWLSTQSFNVSQILKLVAAHTTVYHLWKERNNRLHNVCSLTPEALFKQIDRCIKDTILARKHHPTFGSLLHQWLTYE